MATRLRNQASAKSLAFQSIITLEEGKDSLARAQAMEAYSRNKINQGPKHVRNIYTALDRVYFQSDGSVNQTLSSHNASVKSISVHPTLGIVATADETGLLVFSKADEEKGFNEISRKVITKGQIRSLNFSKDGNYLALISFNGKTSVLQVYEFNGKTISGESGRKLSLEGVPKFVSWNSIGGEEYLLCPLLCRFV